MFTLTLDFLFASGGFIDNINICLSVPTVVIVFSLIYKVDSTSMTSKRYSGGHVSFKKFSWVESFSIEA